MHIILSAVSLLSIISLILSATSLSDHEPKKKDFITANIVGIIVLFVSMILRGMLRVLYLDLDIYKRILSWISILGSGVALSSIAIAYGANILDEHLNVLLGFSLLSLALSALLGHFMKKKEKKESMTDSKILRQVRLLLILISLLLHIINTFDDKKIYKNLNILPAITFSLVIFSLLWFYIGHFKAFFNQDQLQGHNIMIMYFNIDFGDVLEMLESGTTKFLNVLSSAVLLSFYCILYGHTENDLDIASASLILVVIVLDHYLNQ